jgi:hypothetical protein
MSWLFSQALVAEYLEATSLDGELFAPLRSTTMLEAYCWRDKMTESLDLFQFGMTLQPSTARLGAELLTWFRAAFRASTSASPGQCGVGMELQATKAGSGLSASELLTKSDLDSFGGKTRQNSRPKGLQKSFERWPSAGTFQNGSLSALTIADYLTQENEYGFSLPTPTSRDWKDTPGMSLKRKDGKTRTDRLPMLLFSCVRSAGIKWKQMTGTDAQTVKVKGLTVVIRGGGILPRITGMANGVAARVDRLKAIGNGQVPAVAATAFRILTEES